MDLYNKYIFNTLMQYDRFRDYKLKDLKRLYNFIKSYPMKPIYFEKIVKYGYVKTSVITQESIINHLFQITKLFYK